MTTGPVWINGSLAGRIDPADRGLLLGDGVFDTLAAFRRVPFAGARHLERLVAQACEIGIDIDPRSVRAGWDAVLAASTLDAAVIRTTVTGGTAAGGLWPRDGGAPTLMVTVSPWPRHLFEHPVRLATSGIVRNAGSPTARLKAVGYLDNILAAREAAAAGADEAMLLNGAGRVASTTIANIFALASDRLMTPPGADGVLAGITRGLVLETAVAAGLDAAERSLTPAELVEADSVFITNSVRFIRPVLSIDGAPLQSRGAERVRWLSAALTRQIERECGVDPRLLG
jgi:branched-chain amino acid aminotransferase